MMNRPPRNQERGIALTELAVGVSVLFLVILSVIEVSRLVWTHNLLVEATRRGARFAVTAAEDATPVKNMVVYGTASAGTTPLINGLTVDNVSVVYNDFGINRGTVTVSITDFQFQFLAGIVGASVTMPAYKTTLSGESAGAVPDPVVTPTPSGSPGPTPSPTPTPTPDPPPPPSPTPTPTPDPPPPTPTPTPDPPPSPTPTPDPSPTPTPTPTPTPLPPCTHGQVVGSPPTCTCPGFINGSGKCIIN